jgi:hypothetical protein
MQSRHLEAHTHAAPAGLRPRTIAETSVLVVGVYMLDRPNTAATTVAELSSSQRWRVEQKWIGLGSAPVPAALDRVTVHSVSPPVPKFVLLNWVLKTIALTDYGYILVCDDDIELPQGFIDDYLGLVVQHDLALCQPARTGDSFIDHVFVRKIEGITARRTQFVEIGPLFSMRRDAATLLLPFDERSPMGWGYDFVWPRVLREAGLKLGIVDATPVHHRLRRPVAEYNHATAKRQMYRYLKRTPHLSAIEAFSILESYS